MSDKIVGSTIRALVNREFYTFTIFSTDASVHTLTFSGKARTRLPYGFFIICGQTGISEIVPFAFSGNGGYTDITGVMVNSGGDTRITASDKTVTFNPVGNGWGNIIMVNLIHEGSLTWTYE